MEPIRQYLTREGWKADWEQTKRDVREMLNYFRADKQKLFSSDKYSSKGEEEYTKPIILESILDNYNDS